MLHGILDDAVLQTRCLPDDQIEMKRATEPWVKREVLDAPAALVCLAASQALTD